MSTRQQFWIDRPVQGVLIGRVLLYWAIGISYLGISAAIFQYNQQPNLSIGEHLTVLGGQFGPWIPSIVFILPLVMFDIVRLSNLFVGPIYRLRKHLDTMAEDPDCPPLSFRDGDYWQELAVPINSMQLECTKVRRENQRLRNQIEIMLSDRDFKTSCDGQAGAGIDSSAFLMDSSLSSASDTSSSAAEADSAVVSDTETASDAETADASKAEISDAEANELATDEVLENESLEDATEEASEKTPVEAAASE